MNYNCHSQKAELAEVSNLLQQTEVNLKGDKKIVSSIRIQSDQGLHETANRSNQHTKQ